MARTKLSGNYGKFVTVALGDAVTTDPVPEGWHKVTSLVASQSSFAASLSINDLIYSDGTLTNGDGNEYKPLTETDQTDIGNFSFEMSKEEIDVTTLTDDVTKYVAGKTDITGSFEGVFTLGTSDQAGWVINNFMRVIEQQDGVTSVTVNEIDDSDLYIKGVLQKDTSAGKSEAFVWAKVTLTGSSAGASMNEAQSISGSFRVAPGDGEEPTMYVRSIPAA
jgi:hypothetical protein